MYLDFFGLTDHPFELRTDPRFLYLSPAHARAKAYLYYAILKRDSIVTITGDIGCGKSTLIEEVCSELERDVRVIVLHQTQLNAGELLESLLLALGETVLPDSKPQLLNTIRWMLVKRHERGLKTILIVDDAQNLGPTVIEELRMLTDDECDGQRLLSLVMVGQSGLLDTLARDDLEQVRQRITLNYHLEPLDEAQTSLYIDHRLAVAGCRHEGMFSGAAVARVYQHTRGVPRLINSLCNMAMTAGSVSDSTTITPSMIDASAKEMGWLRPRSKKSKSFTGFDGARTRAVQWRAASRSAGTQTVNALTAAGQGFAVQSRALAQRARTAVFDAPPAHNPDAVVEHPLRLAAAALVSLAVVMLAVQHKNGQPRVLEANAPVPIEQPYVADVDVVPSADEAVMLVMASLGLESNLVGPPSVEDEVAMAQLQAVPPTPAPPIELHGSDWLLEQPPANYTVQILGTRDRAKLDKFLRRYDLASASATYSVQRKDRDWYVLVHGVYPDLVTAKRAVAQLPQRVQANKPWIRPLAHVQYDIRMAPIRVATATSDPAPGQAH